MHTFSCGTCDLFSASIILVKNSKILSTLPYKRTSWRFFNFYTFQGKYRKQFYYFLDYLFPILPCRNNLNTHSETLLFSVLASLIHLKLYPVHNYFNQTFLRVFWPISSLPWCPRRVACIPRMVEKQWPASCAFFFPIRHHTTTDRQCDVPLPTSWFFLVFLLLGSRRPAIFHSIDKGKIIRYFCNKKSINRNCYGKYYIKHVTHPLKLTKKNNQDNIEIWYKNVVKHPKIVNLISCKE